jgi:predicted metal-binding protein
MLLFSGKYDLEDSFDFEGMTEGLHAFKKMVDVFAEKIDERLTDYLLLSNEGCGRCETCTYPSSPCRYPSRLYHSIEGYGFVVSELAKHAGIRYINGADTVTYFGALLFRQ